MGSIEKSKIGKMYKFKNQMDQSDDNLYTQRQLESILSDKYGLTLEEYYNIIVYGDKDYIHECMNPECRKKLEFLGLHRGYKGTCNRECANRLHSYRMVDITKTGVYKGTSSFIKYNSLESTRALRSNEAKRAKDDKSSRSFGSEWVSRFTNYSNIMSRYSADSDRYLYLVNFKNYIKVGSTVSILRRFRDLGNDPDFSPIIVIKGKVEEIARYEMNVLREFIEHTIRIDGKFTELLPKDKTTEVIEYYKNLLSNSTTIKEVTDISEELLLLESSKYTQVSGSAELSKEMKI